MSSNPRVKLFSGLPAGEASMPTCGVCHVQIKQIEQYAAVKEDGFELLEVRHVDDCVDWSRGDAEILRDGDLLWTHRFTIGDREIMMKTRVVRRTEEFDERGWRAVLLAPADPNDTSPLDRFRATRNEYFVRLADEIGTIDQSPQRIWLSDRELVHYKRAA